MNKVFLFSLFLVLSTNASGASNTFSERNIKLPELIVSGKNKKVLHIIGYMREYSTLTTLSDTVFLYREKLVDFAPSNMNIKFEGWNLPRIMSSKSYYRFTNDAGLDSVSNKYYRYFTFADYIGLPKPETIPVNLQNDRSGTDTIKARYGLNALWEKDSERVKLEIDLLNDTARLKQFPMLNKFTRDDYLDFRELKIQYLFDGVDYDIVNPEKLTKMSFTIESKGRVDKRVSMSPSSKPEWVSTYAELYVLDREYISRSDANKWRKQYIDWNMAAPYLGQIVPPRTDTIDILVSRVDAIDHQQVRLREETDMRLAGPHIEEGKKNFTVLNRLKFMAKQLLPFL